MSVRTSPTADHGVRTAQGEPHAMRIPGLVHVHVTVAIFQCVTIDRNHHRAVEAPGPCSSPWQTGPPTQTNRSLGVIAGRSPGSMFKFNSECYEPRGALLCGSPMPRGERIAKPAERARRLAGVLSCGAWANQAGAAIRSIALLLDCAPLSGNSPPKLPRTTWMRSVASGSQPLASAAR